MSRRLSALTLALRVLAKPRLARIADPAPLRRDMKIAGLVLGGVPRGMQQGHLDGPVPSLVLTPGDAVPGRHILYFHGGGYVAGSPRSHRGLAARLSQAARARIVLPSYRLGPEAPFPAAQDDARAAFEALVASGVAPGRIVLAGDSAGGGLALSLLSSLCADGIRPAGVVALSPWTDLTGGGASMTANAKADPMLPAHRLDDLVAFAAPGTDRSDPRLSPLFARFDAPPPVLIQCSETEVLRDDSRRMAEVLRSAGGRVTLSEWPDTPHVWQFFAPFLPEAGAAIAEAGRFVAAVTTGAEADAA
ncbi:alpha/beta hydrolase fold domain-containing protein [Rhodobacterales bacterium HKCCE2091]|nr:alpha/beta hydrolase fold domain-containing protein [Rhodobacterales bacterium HKCCE2091]